MKENSRRTFPIKLKKVQVHNLKSINLELQPDQLIVFTGVSGSGKSSLAFDTLYVEGQRRYVESLSNFAKRQIGELHKPDIESASGISPTISIEQKTAGKNPRSTVGTLTEVYDYLRVLYARVAIPHCPVSGEAVRPQSRESILRTVQSLPLKKKIVILAPYAKGKKAEFKEDFEDLRRKGYARVRIDGEIKHLDEATSLDGNVGHDVEVVIDRLVLTPEQKLRIADSITQALNQGQGMCIVLDADTNEETFFSEHAYSPASGLSYPSLEPHDFSFNSPSGMCPRCHGLGIVDDFKLDKVIDPNKSIAEDCCSIATSYTTVRYGNIYDNLARIYNFNVNVPWKKLSKQAQDLFLYGTPDEKWIKMRFIHPRKGSVWIDRIRWRGVLHEANVRFQEAKSESYKKSMAELMHRQTCPECKGKRLKSFPAAAKLQGKIISDVTGMTIEEAHTFFDQLRLSESEEMIASELLKEIRDRLRFLMDVGLHYLTLDRTAPTLSGGEAQRVRLASQIGCGLVGITYVLDEPSIGLHPRDNKKLIQTLQHLRDMGNTVVVVEHDEETIIDADHIIDFGPGAGSKGGEILVDGSLKDLIENPASITGCYLKGTLEIEIPKKRRKLSKKGLEIVNATHHNLKNVRVKIPTGGFICVTGVSGSGKSSLISDILYPVLSNHLHQAEMEVGTHKEVKGIDTIDKVISIDQSPIGRNPRSNPATYIKLFDEIRDLFALLPESRARGYKAGRFSFNVQEGSCNQCQGMGQVKIDMDFMEDAWDECPLCKGKRFDEETLSVKFKEKNIYDILEMDIDEAILFFENLPQIQHKLKTLQRVGMGYIKLGQFSTTLSGGEAQRVKLAKELVRPETGRTLYILDEPTTGLHFHDIKHLLEVLHEFIDRGNTVLVIEHNMDVVKTADWIIDLGPEGGAKGGQIIAEGTPEEIAQMDTPTGIALQEALSKHFQTRIKNIIKKPPKKRESKVAIDQIIIEGAEQNNLKGVSAEIPRDKITVCTGPSGSGKSSFAFETIYAEGQRRYIESLSPYARQFVKQMPKPKVAHIEGLSPAIAIEQKVHAGNPRSTVGTQTEIYDYLRVLYARIGIPHCPETGEVIKAIIKEVVVEKLLSLPEGEALYILAPLEIKRHEDFQDVLTKLQRQGYLRIRLDGTYYDLDSNDIPFDKKKKQALYLVIDRLKTVANIKKRLFEALESAEKIHPEQVIAEHNGKDLFFNLSFAVESTGKSYPPITPHTFSFNTPEGMCPHCEGLGFQYGANLLQNPILENLTITELFGWLTGRQLTKKSYNILLAFLKEENISSKQTLKQLSSDQLQLIFHGAPEGKIYKLGNGLKFRWEGFNPVIARAVRSIDPIQKTQAITLMEEVECLSCHGARIPPLARHVTIENVPIHKLCHMPISEALQFIQSIKLNKGQKKLLEEVLIQLTHRLSFLEEVGLDYISLDRMARTLSGGESQRIRLARQLGSGLTGTLYVLDEPTIGLHPEDNAKLNRSLNKLKSLGNTLILVEHDPQTILEADYILDFGPEAGKKGGEITARGTIKEICKNPKSITGQYLSGKRSVPIPVKRRLPSKEVLKIENACLNNLKNINVSIPLQTLTCVTGVSGSGKSTLIQELLKTGVEKGLKTISDTYKNSHALIRGLNAFEQLIVIDQSPIGLTNRSTVGTYVEVVDRMRDFFAQLPQAKARGLQGKNFSSNHRAGMCTRCFGLGFRYVQMHFLPNIRIECDECRGLRLNPISLSIQYREKNFGEHLNSTIIEARQAFENHPRITRILDTLIEVGLGYLTLGQEMATLSGGEAQRIKLSRELAKRSHGKTLYLLDEPTTGLHSEDIVKLLKVLHRLVDQGNTMVIIEHNLDMIKNADYIIDLGPGAGAKGGELLFEGTPEGLMKCKKSITAKWLKNLKGRESK